MGPAVMPGQDLGEGAGAVRDGAVADLAAGDREMGNGHGEAAPMRHERMTCPARSGSEPEASQAAGSAAKVAIAERSSMRSRSTVVVLATVR